MIRKALFAALLIAAAGCDKPKPKPPATAAQTTNATAAQAKPATDAGAMHDARPTSVKEHMAEHWGLASVIRDAVTAATLDEIPDVAAELAGHETPKALEKYEPQIKKMREAATRAQNAGDLVDASKAVAELARACGDCHVASGARPVEPEEPLPPGESETKAHMLRHDWAARELWIGLAFPSAEHWARGAAGLAEQPLKKGQFFEEWEVTDGLIGLDKAVHEMRPKLAAAATRDERVELYGQLIANCAACHHATAKGPVD